MEPAESVYRELVLIKVKVGEDKRQALVTVCDVFRAKIIDITTDSMIIELTGTQSKINAFIEMLSDYEILEIARTGIAGLRRGSEGVVNLND